jgi:conjugative transfer signal peptidase TraF
MWVIRNTVLRKSVSVTKLSFPVLSMPSRIARAAVFAAFGLMALAFFCYASGLRINTTGSIPVGVYWMTDRAIAKGEYVIFCPPQSALFDEARERGYIGAGFCPGGYGFMMKRVAAMGGDVVTSTEEGVGVNGKLLPASVPLKADKAGRAILRYRINDYKLGESELLLMSDGNITSFDGRYFGIVDVSQVRGVVGPVIGFW